jgi:hypothetical protein
VLNQFSRLLMVSLVAFAISGCGGAKPELPAAGTTPAMDKEKQAKMQEQMKKSFEMSKPKGGKDPTAPK